MQDELSDLADQARSEKERLRAEVREATRNRQLRARDLLRAAENSPELNRQLARVWRRLGISDEADQARLLADELRGAGRPRDAAATAAPVPLTDRELAFLAALGPFVRTPRDAKRLFNLYRMLRATRDLSPASDFLGDDIVPGEFQAVAMLLAMLTADGDLMRQVLDAPRRNEPPVAGGLTGRPAAGTRWRDFALDLSPRPASGTAGETWENQIVGQIPGPDVPAWQRLADATARTENLVLLADLSAFQRWAPRIRHFSYRLARRAPG